MYEALVARVRYHIQKANFMGLKEAESTLLLGEAADAIEELQRQIDAWVEPERKALIKSLPKWIPVTERLPEIHTNVLVMDKAHDMAVGSLERLWDGEVWVCPFADVEDEQVPVTHWMPLPEPPKGE